MRYTLRETVAGTATLAALGLSLHGALVAHDYALAISTLALSLIPGGYCQWRDELDGRIAEINGRARFF